METTLTNVRIERGYDLGGIDQSADVILFGHNGSESLEYLDGDKLGDERDSNLRNYLSRDEAYEIRERLAAWLAGASHIVRWVSADRQGESEGWYVPRGGNVEDVKAEVWRKILRMSCDENDWRELQTGTVEVTPVAA